MIVNWWSVRVGLLLNEKEKEEEEEFEREG